MKNAFAAGLFRLVLMMPLGATTLLTSACGGDEPTASQVKPVTPAEDEAIIVKYIADKGLTGAQRQPSGLYYLPITTNPTGTPAVAGKTVDVLYTGQLLNGTVFDASSQQPGNKPITFVLGAGRVIAGWDEGIALMRKGEKSTLLIPSALAYGVRGAGNGAIPPNAVLRFEVELVDVR